MEGCIEFSACRGPRRSPLNDAATREGVKENSKGVLVGLAEHEANTGSADLLIGGSQARFAVTHSNWRVQAAQRVEGLLAALELTESCMASHESVEELDVPPASRLGKRGLESDGVICDGGTWCCTLVGLRHLGSGRRRKLES